MEQNKLKGILEALIFASDTPLSLNQMKAILEDVEKSDIEAALGNLANDLEGRSIFIKKVGGGFQFATRPEYARWVKQMFIGRERNRLTRAALETLAIIAFKQPISRVEVSAIRGVNCDGVIKNLLERKLVTISGRDEGQGRALLFSTTREFLHYFGINELSDLPKPKEIEELLAQGEGENAIREIPEEEILQDEEEALDEAELEEAMHSGAESIAPAADGAVAAPLNPGGVTAPEPATFSPQPISTEDSGGEESAHAH